MIDAFQKHATDVVGTAGAVIIQRYRNGLAAENAIDPLYTAASQL